MTTAAELGAFVHPALFYRSQQEYVDGVVPFVRRALDNAQPILVAVPGPNLAAVRDSLGDAAAEVSMFDMTVAGRNPGRILGGVLTAFAATHPGESVQMVGEPIWATRSAMEYPACVQHEALINNTFAGRDLAVLCPYDTSQLPPDWLADARATHPVLWEGSARQPSVDFAPDAVWAHYNQPLPRGRAAVTQRVRAIADLAELRAFVGLYGQWFSLPTRHVENARLIATELAAGSLQTADGCSVALWQDNGHLVCDVRDTGQLEDPLAGRRPYDGDTTRGQGLFVVNSVADLVRTHTDSRGTTIQAYLRLDGGA